MAGSIKKENIMTEMSLGRVLREQNILKSFRIIFRSIQAHSRMVERKSGVNSTQLWMLWEIFNNPGMKVTTLADILSIHQSTCSNILDKLQQKDLLKRDRNGPDQRVVHLNLTERGIELMVNAPQPARGAVADALQHLPDELLASMENSLGKLVETLQVKVEDAALKPLDL